ncbi:MAG: DUF4159 domain-containing protein [Pseudomonadota bacterium]
MSALAFTSPLLLLALVALPILWWLLRAVPPAPIRRRFPGVALLLGLTDDESQTDTTPLWLLLLRMAAVAAFIIGFAGPVLNPDRESPGSGPLLIAMDASWASARDWTSRTNRVEAIIREAGRDGRPVALVALTDLPALDETNTLTFQGAEAALTVLPGVEPAPWRAGPDALAWASALTGRFDTIWISDGLNSPETADLVQAFSQRGALSVIESARNVFALPPAVFEDGAISLNVLRAKGGPDRVMTLAAIGPDPNGNEQTLAEIDAVFPAGETTSNARLSLPTELRNRLRRFEIATQRTAGAVSLTDDALKRREIGLISSNEGQEAQDLLSPLHYLRKALAPTADLIEVGLLDMILANPDAIVLADVATFSDGEAEALAEWIENGGFLVRFAGPRLAAASLESDDPLMPVRLRAGGRSVGGAMSWGEPKSLRPFGQDSPFFGLSVPEDIQVTSQVVAQPDPDLAARTVASLTDGTPLVTRAAQGQGQVVLFHVTANAEWSTLPLSGLFVQMLERLAISTRPAEISAADLAGTTWVLEERLDAFGEVRRSDIAPGVAGEVMAQRDLSADLPPGLYSDGERVLALNVTASDTEITPASWPAGTLVENMVAATETPLMGLFLMLALALLAADILASLWLSGRLAGPRVKGPVAVLLLAMSLWSPQDAHAQTTEDNLALAATSEVVLAYVRTGDAQQDRLSQQGLTGLGQSLFRRTSVEPADPIMVDLETDELSFFPLIYWPVVSGQPTPSAQAYAKLNRYLRTGGMILFDTKDANLGGFGSSTPAGRKLQQLARPLDVPALEPIPSDHVLTRTFYLLQDFPGRHASRDVWVEAAPADAERVQGLPFRNLNDGVTPVLIGGNDWASAWARDERGAPLYPVGRGFGGERQRELAIRFGINLVMHVLTGNYKSDQVHVPALLDRLGN